MNWLTPLTGAILAAAVIPPLILLYFLKLRRRAQPIACTLLWKRSIEDLRANAPFQRLRRSLLLLLQLIALLLLIASVMQPQIQAGQRKGGRTVILIDNSASMTATDGSGGGTRLDDAKQGARALVERLYAGSLFGSSSGETMVVAFSGRPEVMSRFSASKAELLAAIENVRPTHGTTSLGEALKLARAYTTNVDPDSDRPMGDPATLEVFTDGRIQDLPEQVLRGETMHYHRVGTADADNVAIGAISVERPFDRPTAVEVFAAMLNFSTRSVTCDVQLSVNESARALEEITLPAAELDEGTGVLRPGRNNVVFTPFDQPRGAIIEVANLRPDDLAADDVAQSVVPPPKQLRVAVVAPKSFLIRSVLEGMALERLEILSEQQYLRLAANAAGAEGGIGGYDVIVFDNFAPPAGMMPPARYLTFGPTPPIEGFNDFGEAGTQIVLNERDEHPALRFVQLDDVHIVKGRLVQPDGAVAVLAEGSRGPVILAVSRGSMQVLHVTFDPVASNWPLLRSWVTFLFNAVDYLGHIGEGITTEGVAVGDAITARIPAGATSITLHTPDTPPLPLTLSDPTRVSWGPVRLAGLYLLTYAVPGADEPERRPIAVNMDAETEGRIDVVENIEVGQQIVSGTPGAGGSYLPLWPYAIGLCLAVLMLEWWVYHRRTYL